MVKLREKSTETEPAALFSALIAIYPVDILGCSRVYYRNVSVCSKTRSGNNSHVDLMKPERSRCHTQRFTLHLMAPKLFGGVNNPKSLNVFLRMQLQASISA